MVVNKHTLKFNNYYDTFIEHGFDDMRFLKDVTNEDLKEIGIDKLGHRKRLLKCLHEHR